MGTPVRGAPRRLEWQGSLGKMKACGARLAQTCSVCGLWRRFDLEILIAQRGAAWSAWGRRDACVHCGGPTHYMASPAPGTPYLPLLPSPEAVAIRKAFLKSFGFSRRDIARIKAHAERCAAGARQAALDDLDAPVRVGAVDPAEKHVPNGHYLGEWAGMTLLFWRIEDGRGLEAWNLKRRGPKGV